uniref:cytoplasmic polyadenylation element-binding protein 1-like n=1 Tax=Myxine glutinosa TaxID=7769 RepID=UPI00358E5DE2
MRHAIFVSNGREVKRGSGSGRIRLRAVKGENMHQDGSVSMGCAEAAMGCAEAALYEPEGAGSGEGESLRSECRTPYSAASPGVFQHMYELFENQLGQAPSCSTPMQPDGVDGRALGQLVYPGLSELCPNDMSFPLLSSLTNALPDFQRPDPPHIFRNNHQNLSLARPFTGMIPSQHDFGLGTLGLSAIGSSNHSFPGLSAMAMNRAVSMKRGMSHRDSSLLACRSGAISDRGFGSGSASFSNCGTRGSCSSSPADSDISTGSEVLDLSGLQISPFYVPFSMSGNLGPHRMFSCLQDDERGLEGADVGLSDLRRDWPSPPGPLDSLWRGWPGQFHMRDVYNIEQQAQLHRQAAAVSEATCTWCGSLPSHVFKNPIFSPKVFLGGVPWDMTEVSIF